MRFAAGVPGYTVSIDGMDKQESDELLDFLFRHQLRPEFQYAHRWNEGDVLMWDNLRTLHNAEADYRADEPRLIKRCQAMADLVFTPVICSSGAGIRQAAIPAGLMRMARPCRAGGADVNAPLAAGACIELRRVHLEGGSPPRR